MRTLQSIRAGHPFEGHHLLWLTDSTNLCAFLSKGSRKPQVQADILEIFWICREFRIRITPVHLSRSDFWIQATDSGTRFFDPDDWGLDSRYFRSIICATGVTVSLVPVSLVIPALLKFCATEMTGVLVVPSWRSTAFWTFIFPDGLHDLPQCWKINAIFPHIVRGKYCYKPLMQGSTAFPFLVLHLVSAGLGYTARTGALACPSHFVQQKKL